MRGLLPLYSIACDFCGRMALCIPIVDGGDGAEFYACGKCASKGLTPRKE